MVRRARLRCCSAAVQIAVPRARARDGRGSSQMRTAAILFFPCRDWILLGRGLAGRAHTCHLPFDSIPAIKRDLHWVSVPFLQLALRWARQQRLSHLWLR